MKDKNIDVFVEKLNTGEMFYENGNLYYRFYPNGKPFKNPKRAGRINTNGYVQLSAKLNGKAISACAHRVIWAYFYGLENLKPELEINHINGNKSDNRIENIELVTASENQIHAYKLGLKKKMYGEKNPDSRLCEEQVKRIKELFNSGMTNTEIAKMFNVTLTNIKHIKQGKTWSKVTGFSQENSIQRVI